MNLERIHSVAIVVSLAGMAFYVFAVLSTFSQGNYTSASGQFVPIAVTCRGGLGALFLGYVEEISLGGVLSLGLADLVARIKGSRQIIEITGAGAQTQKDTFRSRLIPFLVLALIFVTTLILAWDIDSLHPEDVSILHPLISELDFLQHRISSSPLAYVGNVVSEMIVLILIAGAAPSMALPYFRKFRITGVNTEPFHTSFIFTMIGFVGGLGVVLTFARFVLNVIVGPQTIFYYNFIFPIMFGLSLHCTIGAFLGQGRAEDMVKKQVESGSRKRVAKGTVQIQ